MFRNRTRCAAGCRTGPTRCRGAIHCPALGNPSPRPTHSRESRLSLLVSIGHRVTQHNNTVSGQNQKAATERDQRAPREGSADLRGRGDRVTHFAINVLINERSAGCFTSLFLPATSVL